MCLVVCGREGGGRGGGATGGFSHPTPNTQFQVGYKSLTCTMAVTPAPHKGFTAINLSLSEGTSYDLTTFIKLLRSNLAIHVGCCCENPACPHQGLGPEKQPIHGKRYFCVECGV